VQVIESALDVRRARAEARLVEHRERGAQCGDRGGAPTELVIGGGGDDPRVDRVPLIPPHRGTSGRAGERVGFARCADRIAGEQGELDLRERRLFDRACSGDRERALRLVEVAAIDGEPGQLVVACGDLVDALRMELRERSADGTELGRGSGWTTDELRGA
jgi:hypothetical protein